MTMNVEEWRAMGGNRNPALANVHVTSPELLTAERIRTIEQAVLGKTLTAGTGYNIQYAAPVKRSVSSIKNEVNTAISIPNLGDTNMPLPIAAIASGLASAAPTLLGAVQTTLGGAAAGGGNYVKYSSLTPEQQKIWKAGFKRGIRLGRRSGRRNGWYRGRLYGCR